MVKATIGVLCVLLLAAAAEASIIFAEDFESYANQAAMDAVWAPGVGSGAQLSTTQAYSPTQSAYIDLTAQRSDRNFAETVPTDANPLKVSFRFHDSAAGNARQYVQLLDLVPTLAQLVSFGVYNNTGGTVADNNTYYAARVAFAPGPNWFLVNDPGVATRSLGWHDMAMVFGDTTVSFYVDGTLGKVQPYAGAPGAISFDQARIGSGLSTANGDAYYDDFVIEQVPEPTTMALLGLAGLALLRRRR